MWYRPGIFRSRSELFWRSVLFSKIKTQIKTTNFRENPVQMEDVIAAFHLSAQAGFAVSTVTAFVTCRWLQKVYISGSPFIVRNTVPDNYATQKEEWKEKNTEIKMCMETEFFSTCYSEDRSSWEATKIKMQPQQSGRVVFLCSLELSNLKQRYQAREISSVRAASIGIIIRFILLERRSLEDSTVGYDMRTVSDFLLRVNQSPVRIWQQIQIQGTKVRCKRRPFLHQKILFRKTITASGISS